MGGLPYVMHELEHSKSDDQLFLAKMIWPRIYRHTLVHDSLHQALGAKPIAMARVHFGHSTAIGGYGAVSFPVTISPLSPSQTYNIVITDVQSQQLICQYERTAVDDQDRFRIPFDYDLKIKAGEWKIEVAMVLA
jgi:hypothetical protein